MAASEKEERAMIARVLLKSSCIRMRKVNGKLTLTIPKVVSDMISGSLRLSIDDFQVGDGEQISLHDLAFAMDRQASHEAAIGMFCEHLRALKEEEQFHFDTWLELKKHEARSNWHSTYGKWPTESAAMGSLLKQYGKEYKRRKSSLISIEMNYRIMHHAIRSAMIVKGDMMRSMRPLLQVDGSNIVANVPVKAVSETTRKIKV